jgi:YHS domain-containing protein
MKRLVVLLGGAVMSMGVAITALAEAPASQPATQPGVVDLHNTVCPVSGDKVGDSKLTEVYNGKIYHFCCDDCPPAFKKDPEKFAKAVAADPAKYGVK